MIQAFVSASSHARQAQAHQFLKSVAPGTQVAVIGPTREAADDTVRGFLRSQGAATFGIHRFGLAQLLTHLATNALAEKGLAPASPLATQAAAARAAFEASSADELPTLEAVAAFPGFPRALAATLGELRAADLGPAQLDSAPEMQALLRGFVSQLDDGSVADRSRLLRLATDAVVGPASLPAPHLFLCDVPLRSPHEVTFLRALAAAADSVRVTVAHQDHETLDALQDLDGVEVQEIPEPDDSALQRLRAHLFGETPSEPTDDRDASVTFFSAPGEGRECVEIVRKILEFAEAGIPLDQQAVFLRAPGIYAGLLETAMRRADVPAFSTKGTRLPHPSGRAFLALLACRTEGLSARRFAEYLSFAVVPRLEEGAPPTQREQWAPPEEESLGPPAAQARTGQLDLFAEAPEPEPTETAPEIAGSLRAPWKWEGYLMESAVIGGKDRWRRRLDGFERELEIQTRELQERDPESPRLARLQRDQGNVQHLRRFAMPIIELLDEMPERATWGEWLDRLSALAPMVLAQPERVLSTLSELRAMSTIGPVTLDEVRAVLTDTLSTLEAASPDHRYGRVFVGTPEQARGHSFRVVFVPGLAERVFPERPREDPLLLDRARTDIAPTLRTQEDRIEAERLLLRLSIGAAQEQVVLSYPRVNVREARPRVPSFYAIDVDRASRGQIRDFSEMERDAEDQVHARLAWPAPHQAERAVDPAEHDLANLYELLHAAEPSAVKGRARYLLDLNPHLARSLRARWQRFEARKWSPQDGLLEVSPPIADALASQRLAARPYSVTALQRFATCPYQFFLAAVHRLQPREEVTSPVQMDPLTRGNLMHRVQAEILRELRGAGQLPVTPASLPEATAQLDRVLDRVAAEFHDDVAPAIERVWDDEVVGMRTDLRVWMRHLSEEASSWVPAYFEYAFGLPLRDGHDDKSRVDPVSIPGKWLLRGAIDLIETSADGTQLRVTDHKTGRNRTSVGTVVGCGEVLQPVLYSLVAEAAFGKPVELGKLSFATARGGFTERVVPIDDRARYYANQVLEIIDRFVESGTLLPAPKEGACRWCDFRMVCGPYEEARSSRKRSDILADLRELRLLP